MFPIPCTILTLILACAASLAAEALPVAGGQLTTTGYAQADCKDGAITLRFDRPDGSLRIAPPAGKDRWDLSAAEFLAVDLTNLSARRQMRLTMHLTADREYIAGLALEPGEQATLRIRLPHRRLLRMPTGVPGPATLDTTRITGITFQLQWHFETKTEGLVHCRIANLRIEGSVADRQPVAAGDFFPFIDAYGQYRHATWPGKIVADTDLSRAREAERVALERARPPAAWNGYGGWQDGPRLKATGRFRTEKIDGRWHLVDPDGRLFFSHGMDVLGICGDPVKTAGRASWFAVPTDGQSWKPVERNLRMKYGSADQGAYLPIIERRLVHWGFNTIGNWADHRLMERGRFPYTMQITDFDWKMPTIGKTKFYDVFDPRWTARMATLFADEAQRRPLLRKSVEDPWCIGYFIDNEPAFGNHGRLATEVLKCPADQAAKRALVDWLKERHGGIAALNAAWRTSHKDWEALLAERTVPAGTGCETDMRGFSDVMVERYFKACRAVVKDTAPHRLYLGCRFVGTDAVKPELYGPCARHCDVLSVNVYAHSVANFPVEGFPDIPVLIGEFHFGVADRGMFAPGLCLAGIDDADRARAYTRFMEGALRHPRIVGAHWFQYRDQPLLGRWDGEGYQIGFVDVVDTPYPEMVTASRRIGENLYRLRMGQAAGPVTRP